MYTLLHVLSEEERHQIHERSLKILRETGVRVDSQRGRSILAQAGAAVNHKTGIVSFPRTLVEQALQAAPKQFCLGGRRPDWSLPMNAEECTLIVDSQAVFVIDPASQLRRPPTYEDWLKVTHLTDALDDFGAYWCVVQLGLVGKSIERYITYWRNIFSNFSKHVQESTDNPGQTRWMMEVLQVIFGNRETIQRVKPLSFLLCPLSPLALEETYTDAYLETIGWDIPVAVMPMPLMGTTAPGTLIATLILANCEVLSALCLVQAAAPGTPFIYAATPGVTDPRSGRYGSGEVENGLLGAAITEMGRYYGLPVQASTGGTDHHIPGIQAGYERGINWTLPVLSWPDLLVGPGLLGGSMILSLEQLVIDIEIFRRCKRLAYGIGSAENQWLDDVIAAVGPGGNFLNQRSTREALRSGEWYISKLGVHSTFEGWVAAGRPTLLEDAHREIDRILSAYQPLPLDEAVERELDSIQKRAAELSPG